MGNPMRYRRATTPGATYCFTVVTYQRQNLFHHPKNVALLRHAFRTVKANHPFEIDAIVVLPDHLHCVWTLPPGDADFNFKYNHLVANCLIFYNVVQISQILNQLIQEGYSFSTEAIAALSPYGTEHINRLGRYQLDLERKPPELLFDLPIVNPEQTIKSPEIVETPIK